MGTVNTKSTVSHDIPWNPWTSALSLNNARAEPFSLIWLDENALDNSLDALRIQVLLRQISNDNCLSFDQLDPFISEIEKMTMEHKKFLLVMSSTFAKKVLPKIRVYGISTAIIFCQNYHTYVPLSKQYSDAVHICTDQKNLKTCIEKELVSLKFNLFENRELKTFEPLFVSNEINNSDAYFSYMLFIEVLKQMPQTKQAKDIMLDQCKDYYRTNQREIKRIEEFFSCYTAKDAIYWYTTDTFHCRLVNRVLRTDDVALWYLFRCIITDLCTQLEKVHKEQNIRTAMTVYRGQHRMPTKELEFLKSNVDGLVSVNGFFSTSTSFDIAKLFICGAVDDKNFKVVIFEITVDGSRLQNTVFVDIDKYTEVMCEGDILFNIGSVFRIKEVNYSAEYAAWMIKMEATDEGTYEIKKKLDAKKGEFRHENMNLMFGRLLIDMNKYTNAESYFQTMLQVLPKSHADLPFVHDYIGDLNMKTTNWKEAFNNFYSAYEMRTKILPVDHPLIGISCNNIGNYYEAIKHYLQALEWYKKAFRCQNNQFNTARICLNIGRIYGIMNQYDTAIDECTKARDILQQIHPCPYDEIIQCQILIGKINFLQKNYIVAREYYLAAVEMSKRVLSIHDRRRIDSINHLADLYHVQGMKQEALKLCLDELSLYEKYLSPKHVNIAHLTMKVGELSEDDDQRRIDSLLRALEILKICVHVEYAATADCLMMIAEYYQKRDDYNATARKYSFRALEIRKKIYPEDHQIIKQTRSIIDTMESLEANRETNNG